MTIFDQIRKKFNNHDPEQMKQEILWLFENVKRYKSKILLVGILGVIGTVMGLVSSVASKYLIDAVIGFQKLRLIRTAVAMIILTLGSLVFQGISSRVSASIHLHIKNEIQHMTYGRILRAGWEALEPYRSGDLLNRLTSDVNTVSDGIKVILTIIRLYSLYRPGYFFGVVALILALLSGGFFIPVLITYFKTGLVPNFPTLIVCGFTALSALLFFFTGVQLQNMVKKSKQEFEIERIKANYRFRESLSKQEKEKNV